MGSCVNNISHKVQTVPTKSGDHVNDIHPNEYKLHKLKVESKISEKSHSLADENYSS